jgi:hypothetical protein
MNQQVKLITLFKHSLDLDISAVARPFQMGSVLNRTPARKCIRVSKRRTNPDFEDQRNHGVRSRSQNNVAKNIAHRNTLL